MAQVKKILESNKINSIWRFYYSTEYKQIEKEMMNKNADAELFDRRICGINLRLLRQTR